MSVRLITGDCCDVLPTLDADSFDCVVTSPPYWGLRDYGTARWDDGDPTCDHIKRYPSRGSSTLTSAGIGQTDQGSAYQAQKRQFIHICSKCGAKRTDGQIGLEPTLDAYVETMVGVFREVRRVIKPEGTCWLNLGDCYAGSWGAQSRDASPHATTLKRPGNKLISLSAVQIAAHPKGQTHTGSASRTGLKPKDLCGVPWRVAFALQADGWWLRSAIVWAKPNPMPESVTDRPTSAYEMMFLLTKAATYFYDAEAIKETAVAADIGSIDGGAQRARDGSNANNGRNYRNGKQLQTAAAAAGSSSSRRMAGFNERWDAAEDAGAQFTRNSRNVWAIASQPFRGSHFATMPPDLAERCIKAGSSEKGCCPHCGRAWERQVETLSRSGTKRPGVGVDCDEGTKGRAGEVSRLTTGWSPSCSCPAHEPIPARVLDPFGGAGTTGLVADRLGRNAILIELNPAYRELACNRVTDDAPLFAEISA